MPKKNSPGCQCCGGCDIWDTDFSKFEVDALPAASPQTHSTSAEVLIRPGNVGEGLWIRWLTTVWRAHRQTYIPVFSSHPDTTALQTLLSGSSIGYFYQLSTDGLYYRVLSGSGPTAVTLAFVTAPTPFGYIPAQARFQHISASGGSPVAEMLYIKEGEFLISHPVPLTPFLLSMVVSSTYFATNTVKQFCHKPSDKMKLEFFDADEDPLTAESVLTITCNREVALIDGSTLRMFAKVQSPGFDDKSLWLRGSSDMVDTENTTLAASDSVRPNIRILNLGKGWCLGDGSTNNLIEKEGYASRTRTDTFGLREDTVAESWDIEKWQEHYSQAGSTGDSYYIPDPTRYRMRVSVVGRDVAINHWKFNVDHMPSHEEEEIESSCSGYYSGYGETGIDIINKRNTDCLWPVPCTSIYPFGHQRWNLLEVLSGSLDFNLDRLSVLHQDCLWVFSTPEAERTTDVNTFRTGDGVGGAPTYSDIRTPIGSYRGTYGTTARPAAVPLGFVIDQVLRDDGDLSRSVNYESDFARLSFSVTISETDDPACVQLNASATVFFWTVKTAPGLYGPFRGRITYPYANFPSGTATANGHLVADPSTIATSIGGAGTYADPYIDDVVVSYENETLDDYHYYERVELLFEWEKRAPRWTGLNPPEFVFLGSDAEVSVVEGSPVITGGSVFEWVKSFEGLWTTEFETDFTPGTATTGETDYKIIRHRFAEVAADRRTWDYNSLSITIGT
jgi:hypothetical protein